MEWLSKKWWQQQQQKPTNSVPRGGRRSTHWLQQGTVGEREVKRFSVHPPSLVSGMLGMWQGGAWGKAAALGVQ